MSLAFLYAGQGSQKVGMGRDIYDAYPEIRPVFESGVTGHDLKSLCFDGPQEQLDQTEYTQPCMAAFAVAVTKILYSQGIRPSYAAGLSLGEYNALYAAGVFDENTLLKLLAFRGKVMAESVKGRDSSMTAVLGLGDDEVRKIVEDISGGIELEVSCANFNCPGQIVIGGDNAAVTLAEEACLDAGAKRCIPLQVSGPFHTPLMEEASRRLSEKLNEVKFQKMQIPVLFNVTGKELEKGQTVSGLLTRQVMSPVLFSDIIRNLEALGVDQIIEIGPGKVLSGFVKKTAPAIKVSSIDDMTSLQKALWELGVKNK